MANQLSVTKSVPTRSRKLPFLPRIGIYVDFAGKQYVFKMVPLAEDLLALHRRGFSLQNFMKVALEQLEEVPINAKSQIRTKKTKKK